MNIIRKITGIFKIMIKNSHTTINTNILKIETLKKDTCELQIQTIAKNKRTFR